MNINELELELPAEYIANIFGPQDSYAKIIEKTLNVTVIPRNDGIKIIGDDTCITKAKNVFNALLAIARNDDSVNEQNVNYSLSLELEGTGNTFTETDKELICHTVQGKPIKPKTLGQKAYIELIRKNMVVFSIGPAGTGKTYLAMAMAITAFKNNDVNRIILTRPAIEAGEKLGFLPGDLQSKIDPYLRPLYDALYQIIGPESFMRNSEKGLIEVAPLAYMRGRTLDNAYIILDEAQNTTPAQMKMFLTRIGFGSKVIITGDLTQKDLPAGQASGLDIAVKVLSSVEGIGFSYLTAADVVRHPLVQKIVKAYDAYEKKTAYREQRKEHHQKIVSGKIYKKKKEQGHE